MKEKLEKMKRGELYFYYTSYELEGKRRVQKLWLDLSDADEKLIPEFVERIAEEFISGKTNPFEVAYVIKKLRENGYLNLKIFERILSSEKLQKTPSILKGMLIEEEKDNSRIDNLISEMEQNKLSSDEWIDKALDQLQV